MSVGDLFIATLMEAADFNGELLPPLPDRLLLLLDSLQASGSFLLLLMLRLALQRGDKVVLVALDQSLDVYQQCMKKLGVSLQSYIDSKQLQLLGFSELFGRMTAESPCQPQQQHSASLPASCSSSLQAALVRIEEAVTEALSVTWAAPLTPVCILFDNISALAAMRDLGAGSLSGPGQQKDWLAFLHSVCSLSPRFPSLTALRSPLQDPMAVAAGSAPGPCPMAVAAGSAPGPCPMGPAIELQERATGRGGQQDRGKKERFDNEGVISCIMLAHTDIPSDMPWVRYLRHRAEATVEVSSLGFPVAEVDGTVSITRRRRDARRGVAAAAARRGRAGGQDDIPALSPWQQQPLVSPAAVKTEEPMECVRSLYFSSADTGVKWIQMPML